MKPERQKMYQIVGCECDWCHKERAKMVNLFHPAQPEVPREYYQIALCAVCLRRALKIAEAPDADAR